jgi:Ca2+-dependent lipid-binding protein
MQNLDKLEQDIQVDKWAEIIREKDEKDKKELEKKNGPLPRRAPKTEKYVFTIKIIEAEDLPACDINGFSDPYVVLGDEFQKRLAKTRIIYRNLNPRWDETVDIITTGPLNIVATIWDWDRLGDHDCVGRTSLKLDPSSFRDFMPREYWLDLDSQGRLLLRVSMEGERDDIQFYFGKSFRALKRTGRDMTRNITDKVSAFNYAFLVLI